MSNKYGLDALKSQLNEIENKEGKKGQNVRRYLEADQSIVVRIPSLDTCASFYKAHSDFETEIRPHACHLEKENGEMDVYDILSERFLKDASACYKSDPDRSKELWLKGKRLEPRIRVLFGFYSLEDGEPVIFDLSKKYGEALIKTMEEFGEEINQYAFKLSRSGAESNTSYTLMPIIKGMSDEQKGYFTALEGKAFDTSLYENCKYFKEHNDMVEDLIKMGYDVSEFTGEKTPLQVMKEKETPNTNLTPAAEGDLSAMSAEQLDEIYSMVTAAGYEDKNYQQQVLAEVERRIEESNQEASRIVAMSFCEPRS